MVIDPHGGRARGGWFDRPGSDDAAYRLAAAVAADPSVTLTREGGLDRGIGALAARLEPVIAWARTVSDTTDDVAVRRGVLVAATRMLLGVPQRTLLVAFQELPIVLAGETSAPRRLEDLAIEVGLRLRGLPSSDAKPPQRPRLRTA